MKTTRRWQCLVGAVGLVLTASLTGCQTNIAGMTLPSGHYLQHPPQYFPPSPPFPLTRELATMQAQSGVSANTQAPLPPPQANMAPVPGMVPVQVQPAAKPNNQAPVQQKPPVKLDEL